MKIIQNQLFNKLLNNYLNHMGNTCCQQTEQFKGVLAGRVTLTAHYQPSTWPKDDQVLDKIIETNQLRNAQPFKRSDGQVYYCGEMKNQQPHGKGILYSQNKIFYSGQFYDGYPDGEGKVQFYNKNYTYEGAFKKGQAEGVGRFRNEEEKYQFKGEWIRSMPQKGFIKFDEDPTQIQLQQTIDNTVTIHYCNGKVYTGQINKKSFLPEGVGTVFYQDGKRTYTGQWQNGLMNGKGVYQWKDGNITVAKYDGDYCQGRKQGYGKFQFQSGNIYEGYFCNGKRNGHGQLFDKNGTSIAKGQWKDDELIQCTEEEIKHQQSNKDFETVLNGQYKGGSNNNNSGYQININKSEQKHEVEQNSPIHKVDNMEKPYM